MLSHGYQEDPQGNDRPRGQRPPPQGGLAAGLPDQRHPGLRRLRRPHGAGHGGGGPADPDPDASAKHSRPPARSTSPSACPGVARFRANFYVQRGSVAMVFRHVPVEIQTTDDLGLPRSSGNWRCKPRGLMLVTGTVGSGKSTTLASIVDIINREYCPPRHHHRGSHRVPAPGPEEHRQSA